MTETNALPDRAGVGFKPAHFDEIMGSEPQIGFIEIHAENYMGAGGPAHRQLETLRERYALSIHGVGLSIGSPNPLDREHLARLRRLCERHPPASFSEHLAWSSHGDVYLNDLLPLPYTEQTLARVVEHIDQVQSCLNRRMLLEKPSTYVEFTESSIPEIEFLAETVRKTGCGLLLDVNNVFVSCTNHSRSPSGYLAAFPIEHVGEIHLGGHDCDRDDTGARLLIDAHGTPVADPVWALYQSAIERVGPLPTLIEWDNNVPRWPVLAAEARSATAILDEARRKCAA